MPGTELPALHTALVRVMALFQETGVGVAVIGGVAVGVRAAERMTVDIDFTTSLDNESLASFCEAAERRGIRPRRTDGLEFARRYRVLLLVDTDTDTDLDLALASLPFELEAIERAEPVLLGPVVVPVVTAEDLVVMKMVAGRPQDLVDVSSILEGTRAIDLRRIRQYLEEFDDALDRPGLPGQFETILAQVRRRTEPPGE